MRTVSTAAMATTATAAGQAQNKPNTNKTVGLEYQALDLREKKGVRTGAPSTASPTSPSASAKDQTRSQR